MVRASASRRMPSEEEEEGGGLDQKVNGASNVFNSFVGPQIPNNSKFLYARFIFPFWIVSEDPCLVSSELYNDVHFI